MQRSDTPKKQPQIQRKKPVKKLHDLLQSKNVVDQTEAMRKIVLATAENKDCSFMYMDILKIIQTNDVPLKQLIYLYITAYASSNEQAAILTVNSLVIDSHNYNPHVRGLALRTMGNIKLQMTAEYFFQPLLNGLDDKDPYVRRCAVLGMLKLLQLNCGNIDKEQVINKIIEMLNDKDPTVVGNCLHVLDEFSDIAINIKKTEVISSLLSLMEGSKEYDQAIFLHWFNEYEPKSKEEAERIVQMVFDKASVTNEGVVIDTIKLVKRYYSYLDKEKIEEYVSILGNVIMKINANLTSTKAHDTLYVFYRNIKHFIKHELDTFTDQYYCFYISYDDPLYLRLEKLEILLMLSTPSNAHDILDELLEYSLASIDFAPHTLNAIAMLANKHPTISTKCINALVDVSNKIPQLSQHCLSAFCITATCYKEKYIKALPILIQNIEVFDDIKAKCSLIFICGEYCQFISNSQDVVANFIQNYGDEPLEVRLQLLTAAAKIYTIKPFSKTTQMVLQLASQSSIADERERAIYLYRMLSSKRIINNQIQFKNEDVDNTEALYYIGSISTVLGCSYNDIQRYAFTEETFGHIEDDVEVLEDLVKKNKELLVELKKKRGEDTQVPIDNSPLNQILSIDNNPNDFAITGSVCFVHDKLQMKMKIKNISGENINGLVMEFNANSFGLSCGEFEQTSLKANEEISFVSDLIQIGVTHNSKRLSFYKLHLPIYYARSTVAPTEPKICGQMYSKLLMESTMVTVLKKTTPQTIKDCLLDSGFKLVAEKMASGLFKLIVILKLVNGVVMISDMEINLETKLATIKSKADNDSYLALLEKDFIEFL
ncbi:AP complex subunit beta [Entamoeba marina]